jgi:Flp pilus assembly protein TadG
MRRTPSASFRRWGTVAVLVSLCLIGMIGVIAIAVDGGVLLDDQHQLQAAADAAALAAATDLYVNYTTNQGADPNGKAAQSAQTTATANGFSNGTNGTTVTVHIPPTSGAFNGQAGYAEVIIQYNQVRYFSNALGSGAIPIQVRAVARGIQTPYSTAGILLLDPTGSGAFNDQGNGLTVTGAPILINSSNSSAASLTGNASVTAPQMKIVGNYAISGGNASINGTVSTGVTATPDPLATLPVPVTSTLTVQSNSLLSYSGGSVNLQPGVYNGGIALSSSASATLQPGVYYLNGGGLNVSGQASLTGNGVMIYNNPLTSNDAINISGQGTVSLSPPTSGTYMGLTFFQNRTSTVGLSLSGNGNLSITGTIYAPGARLTVSGNGTMTVGSQYITDDLTTTGNGTFDVPWSTVNVARLRDIRLVK